MGSMGSMGSMMGGVVGMAGACRHPVLVWKSTAALRSSRYLSESVTPPQAARPRAVYPEEVSWLMSAWQRGTLEAHSGATAAHLGQHT